MKKSRYQDLNDPLKYKLGEFSVQMFGPTEAWCCRDGVPIQKAPSLRQARPLCEKWYRQLWSGRNT